MTQPERIPAALAGERLDRVVSLLLGCSRSEASRLVAEGVVSVNSRPVTARTHRVTEGDEVVVPPWEPAGPVAVAPEPAVPVTLIHVDDDVIVVDKPAGMVVHPGSGHEKGTLAAGLLARFPELLGVGDPDRPGIVHRLDRDTSGLLMVARTTAAHSHLVDQLARRTVERRYDALVWGRLATRAGVVDAPIGRSPRHPVRMEVVEGGRPARTHYEVQAVYADPVAVTRLACRLETGRTHQIRVHLRAIGHAVVGDPLYDGVRQSFPLPRQFLHAEHLGFVHPATGEHLVFDSPLPPDLRGSLDRLS